MEINREDLRSVKTEEQLRHAFRKLAMQKDMKEISVRELTDLAKVNRKTFYLHYHNIDEFVVSLQQEFANEVAKYLGDVLEQKDGILAFYLTLCYLAEDPDWSYLICTRYDYGQVWKVVADPALRPWKFEEFLKSSKRSTEMTAYLLGAMRNVFCLWYEQGMPVPKEEMARAGTELVYKGVYGAEQADCEREETIWK